MGGEDTQNHVPAGVSGVILAVTFWKSVHCVLMIGSGQRQMTGHTISGPPEKRSPRKAVPPDCPRQNNWSPLGLSTAP